MPGIYSTYANKVTIMLDDKSQRVHIVNPMQDLNTVLLILSLSVIVPALMSCVLVAPTMVPEIADDSTVESYPMRAALMLWTANCYCEGLMSWDRACRAVSEAAPEAETVAVVTMGSVLVIPVIVGLLN